jgi:hypothetical protein
MLFLHGELDESAAVLLISTWGTIIICHEVGTYWLTGSDIHWPRPASVFATLAYCIMNRTSMAGFIAVLAMVSVVRSLDYMVYAVQCLFPTPPEVTSPRWLRFLHIQAIVQMLFSKLDVLEQFLFYVLLTTTIWNERLDLPSSVFVSYMSVVFHVKDTAPVWPYKPPVVLRDQTGMLMIKNL